MITFLAEKFLYFRGGNIPGGNCPQGCLFSGGGGFPGIIVPLVSGRGVIAKGIIVLHPDIERKRRRKEERKWIHK